MVSDNSKEMANTLLLKNRNSDVKVQIVPMQAKTLTHLPKRPKVDLAFSDLSYTVVQGSSKYTPNEFLLVIYVGRYISTSK